MPNVKITPIECTSPYVSKEGLDPIPRTENHAMHPPSLFTSSPKVGLPDEIKSTPSSPNAAARNERLSSGVPAAEAAGTSRVETGASREAEAATVSGEIVATSEGDSAGKNTTSATPAADFDPAADPEGLRCSLRGLVWKVLLGTFHTDANLYIRLVGRGPSSEDVKIREDTFRTFAGDKEFRRRVPEDKLSRINNAFVTLNSPSPTNEETTATASTAAGGDVGNADGQAPRESRVGSSGSSQRESHAGNAPREGRADSASSGAKNGSSDGDGWDEPEGGKEGGAAVVVAGASGGSGGSGGGGSGKGVAAGAPRQGKGKYVQGMTVLSAPLLFVMPEVDAFYCFNSLLNEHMPR